MKKAYDKFTSYETLEEIVLNGVTYRVVDKKNSLFPSKAERALVFKKAEDKGLFFHSKIYTNPKKVFQPYGVAFQKIFDCWGKIFSLNNALILGCAGCSFPRFLALRFPQIKIIGVEYLKEFVALANKYFLIDDIKCQFKLLEADAFAFVENNELTEKQDLIMVDVFDGNCCPDEVFSDAFIKALYGSMSDSSIVVFNFLKIKKEIISEFVENIKEPFDERYIVAKDEKNILLLIKSKEKDKVQKVIKNIEKELKKR